MYMDYVTKELTLLDRINLVAMLSRKEMNYPSFEALKKSMEFCSEIILTKEEMEQVDFRVTGEANQNGSFSFNAQKAMEAEPRIVSVPNVIADSIVRYLVSFENSCEVTVDLAKYIALYEKFVSLA